MPISGLKNARDSLHLLVSNAKQSDVEHSQINRVYKVLIAPYQGLLFVVACAALWGHVPVWWLATFLALFVAEVCVKIIYTNRYNSLEPHQQKGGYWRRVMWIGMGYSGVVYGLAALVVFYPMPVASLVVVIGVFASSICINTIFGRSYLPICFTTIIPMFLPVIIVLLASEVWQFQLLAAMMAGVCILLVHFFRITALFNSNLINARAENERLLQHLTVEKSQSDEQRIIAEQAVVEKNLFIAAASHDLRQPLHAFGLFLSSMKKEQQSEKSRRLINHMETSTIALNKLFDNLLDLSKLDAGMVVANPVNFQIGDILSVIRNEFGELAAAKTLSLDVNGDHVCVYTDKVLLERILRNFTANAIEYTDSGSVTINAIANNNGTVVLEVSDTGCGIPAEEIPHVFSEYHQLKTSGTTSGKGVGLGLAIVDKICTLLGHTLEVESNLGYGTNFILNVPAGERSGTRTPCPIVSGDDLTGRRVLIVDDNEDILLGMQLIFSSWGCTPLLATNAEEAIRLVTEAQTLPEYLLCDFQLTGSKSGLDVIREINSNCHSPLPAAIVTGDTAPERLKEIESEGITVLHKPVVPESLKQTICDGLAPA